MNKQRRSVIIDGREVHSISQAAVDVLAERRRQIEDEGWTLEHDDAHEDNALGLAAACYAMSHQLYLAGYIAKIISRLWPWDAEWWKPKSYRENLVRAGALIIAGIDRLDRSRS